MIFDSGTIDGIQTLKCLVTHVSLGQCFMLTSFPVDDGDASAIRHLIRTALSAFEALETGKVGVAGLVCDNAPAYILACELLRQTSSKYAHVLHFNCSCHVLNLASKDIDKAITAELGGASDDKFLLENDYINRICPTRWWAKLKEYHRLVNSPVKTAKLLYSTDGLAILNRVKAYIAATYRAYVMARLLEKDSSNCVVAVWGLLTIINIDNRVAALAVLNRKEVSKTLVMHPHMVLRLIRHRQIFLMTLGILLWTRPRTVQG